MKIEEYKQEARKIIRGQYPDLFDISKNGQNVWLEKSYMESMFELTDKLMDLAYETGWKDKGEQMLRIIMKDYVPK